MIFDRFFGGDPASKLVLGTHVFPFRLFAESDLGAMTQDLATEVVASVDAEDHEILVTRVGGLFVRPPEEISNADTMAKLAFEETMADSINLLVCEMATRGFVSEPTSPMHIGRGELIEGHAVISSGGGHPLRASYKERTLLPTTLLHEATWVTHFAPQNPAILEEAADLTRASTLRRIASSLPAFVAGAYALWSRRQVAEALIDAWIVCEQILDHLWKRHRIDIALDNAHRDRLKDTRTYTASVQAEVLFATEVLPEETYVAVQRARKRRNDLAHRATVDVERADEGLVAMKRLLDLVLGEDVAEPMLDQFVSW